MEDINCMKGAFAPNKASVYRYEKKFVAVDQSVSEIEWIIKKNPFLFRSIFHERQVNNIYFDTPNFEYFYDNVDGNSRRKKFRIRWYGDLLGPVNKPVIEAKIKSGDLGTKRKLAISNFQMTKQFSASDIEALLGQLPTDASELALRDCRPTLVNSYIRKYYLSADGRYRITLDRSLKYYKVGLSSMSELTPLTDRRKLIIELKYDQCNADSAKEITKHFPFRVSKNSKYVSGIRKTFYHLAENDDLGDAF
mgnify:CR=1 FL=1